MIDLQADLFKMSGVIVPDDRAREYEMDLTPVGVVRQLFHELVDLRLVPYQGAFLDPSAGAGVFGKVCAEAFPNLYRVAIEPRDEEHDENLPRHYHETWRGTLESASAMLDDVAPFALIATNPPFSEALSFVEMLVPRLDAATMWLLQLDDFGQRSMAGQAVFDRFPPAYQLRISGAIGFRGPGVGKDSRSYSWWGWVPGTRTRGWRTWTLPRLPTDDTRWSVRPGEVA